MTVEKQLTVQNRAGMHLRAASKIVSALRDFKCDVELTYEHRTANARSIMSLTQLIAPPGSVLFLRVKGPDAVRAALALEKLFQDRFGEE